MAKEFIARVITAGKQKVIRIEREAFRMAGINDETDVKVDYDVSADYMVLSSKAAYDDLVKRTKLEEEKENGT